MALDFLNNLMLLDLLAPRDAILFISTSAFIVHLIYNRFEIQPENVPVTFLLLFITPVLASLPLLPHVGSVGTGVAASFAIFHSCLLTTIIIYRISPFHPLAKFPGPRLLKVSKLVGMWVASRGKQQVFLKELHEKYGPSLQGPNELSIVDVLAISPLMGAQGLPKGPSESVMHWLS